MVFALISFPRGFRLSTRQSGKLEVNDLRSHEQVAEFAHSKPSTYSMKVRANSAAQYRHCLRYRPTRSRVISTTPIARAHIQSYHTSFLPSSRGANQNEARKTAERRITSAREAATRRSEGDLQNAAERLAEERELFKSQLGAAHAKILRLGAEAAELERRNVESTLVGEDELKKEEELDQKRLDRRRNPIDVVNSDDSGRVNNSSEQAGQNGFLYHDGDAHKPRAHAGPSARICTEAKEKETIVEGVEGEREALRQMCNGLAVDLQEAMKARADAEKNRDALAEVKNSFREPLTKISAA